VDLYDPGTVYVPELLERDVRFGGITLRHLLTMTSGLRFEEWTSPWDDPTRTYYATDLRATALDAVIVEPPGTVFRYNDYNPLLVGMVLERATGMSVSEYLETRLWQPMGAEANASWSLDGTESGFEKMSTGFNARPLDYARFGRLMLDGGRRGEIEIVPEGWVAEATRIDGSDHNTGYQYFWWVDTANNGFEAEGDHCQFVYLHPDTDLVLVRTGHSCGGVYWTGFLGDIAEWIEGLQA
jgi:CubicO group peptidase (beta-lactamase class C family)